MTALEILNVLNTGEAVELSTGYVMAFLRECERLKLTSTVIQLKFIGTRCILTVPRKVLRETLGSPNPLYVDEHGNG